MNRGYLAAIASVALLAVGACWAVATQTSGTKVVDATSTEVSAGVRTASLRAGEPASTDPTTTLSLPDSVNVAAAVAPQPTDWGSRVRMKGCGAIASVRGHPNGKLLLVNAGTVTRTIVDGGGLLYFTGALIPTNWQQLGYGRTVPATYRIKVRTATCPTVANTIVVTVS